MLAFTPTYTDKIRTRINTPTTTDVLHATRLHDHVHNYASIHARAVQEPYSPMISSFNRSQVVVSPARVLSIASSFEVDRHKPKVEAGIPCTKERIYEGIRADEGISQHDADTKGDIKGWTRSSGRIGCCGLVFCLWSTQRSSSLRTVCRAHKLGFRRV